MWEPGSSFAQRRSVLSDRLREHRDPQARLAWVVERARERPGLSPADRTPDREVPGCASRLWLKTWMEGGRCRFRSDSESAILKALSGLVCDLYDGLTPDEVRQAETGVLGAEGLARSLTENRRRTLGRFEEELKLRMADLAHTPRRRADEPGQRSP